MKKKYIEVIQEEISDCGISCLSSIIQYYGGYIPLEKLRIDTNTDNNGTNAYELIQCSKKYGINAIAEKTNKVSDVNTPFIAHVKLDNNYYHFIVVYKILDNKLLIMDPLVGLKKIDLSYFNEIFNKVVIKFISSDNIPTYKKNTFLYRYIINYVRDNKYIFLWVLILNLIILILTFLENMEISFIKNVNYIIIFLVIIIINHLLQYVKNKIVLNKSIDLNNKLLNDFSIYIFKLPLKYLKLKQHGEINTRFNEISEISSVIVSYIINILFNMVQIIISFFLIFYFFNNSFIPLFLFSLIYIFFNVTVYKKNIKTLKNLINKEEEYNNKILNYISQITTIKHLSNYNYFLNNIKDLNISKNDTNRIINKRKYKMDLINNLIISIFSLMVLYLLLNSSLNVEASLFIYIVINYYISLIKTFSEYIPIFLLLKSIINKNNDFLSIDYDNKKSINITGDILINIHNLSYEINGSSIIKDLNICIDSKDKVFIKGPSGIGKSTFLKIINNEISNYKGDVLINGYNIKDYDLSNSVTYVSQTDGLFNDTLINNIILNNKIDKTVLNKIIKMCRIDEIDLVKKYGFDVMCLNNNIFSGGEKNRIILARALVRCKNILILDEVLREVDYSLECEIVKDIIDFYKDRIIIYVSHKDVSIIFDKVLTFRKDYYGFKR